MAGSRNNSGDGFATPAAAAVSLGVAAMAASLVVAASSELRFARRDLERTNAEYALDGIQTEAALSVVASTNPGRLRWSSPGVVEILAEPETDKLSVASIALVDDTTLARLGVTDAPMLRQKLSGFSGDAAAVADADAAPAWRACAQSLISPYGGAARLPSMSSSPPDGAATAGRIGQLWRLRVTVADGWVDDRIVRFTGDATHPAATIERRFSRAGQEGDRCAALANG